MSRQSSLVSRSPKTTAPSKPPIQLRRNGKKLPFAIAGLVLIILAVSVALMLARSSRGSAQASELPREISRLKLEGIFFSGSMGYALVNNEVVQAGDLCGGVRIKEIKDDAVLVQDGGIEYTLKTGN
jgi:hypothetical protein